MKKHVLLFSAAVFVFNASLMTKSQFKNASNILMVNNPTENIGSFWYIMLEMFKDRLEFMKLLFVLETAVMYCMITFLLWKTYNVLDE